MNSSFGVNNNKIISDLKEKDDNYLQKNIEEIKININFPNYELRRQFDELKLNSSCSAGVLVSRNAVVGFSLESNNDGDSLKVKIN